MHALKGWKYPNLTFFVFSLLSAAVLTRAGFFQEIVAVLGSWAYVGAFFAGLLFVSTFTVSFGGVLLFQMAESLTVWEVALAAGLGAVVSDFFIFKFVKNNLVREVQPLYNTLGGKGINHVLHTRYFSWTLPFVGALIIASPLPDEIGVSLMGLSKMKAWQFLAISFALNALGITLVILGASLF